jgi:hypothetical protein
MSEALIVLSDFVLSSADGSDAVRSIVRELTIYHTAL